MESFSIMVLAVALGAAAAYMPTGKESYLTDALFREMATRMGSDLLDSAYLDFPDTSVNERVHKDLDALDYELEESPHPSTRDGEYLQHSSLWGHQYLSGGAGEGKQRLRPDGAIENHKTVKTDASLPAYCNPPNPCPVGYSVEDGCLEEFENSASFSRDYQAAQKCMCDSEHMFDCPSARESTQRNEISKSDIDRFVHQFQEENPHKTLVAKKFHSKKSHNPYLQGERLPVAAKKGYNVN